MSRSSISFGTGNSSSDSESLGAGIVDQKQHQTTTVKIATEFLLKSNNSTYLFSTFYNALEAFGLKDNFLYLLEEFI